ncbi:gamma-glutamyltransferase family protein [Candidatus Poriferisodalis sp.]|uniref:gamma-glutamyltransferase family protein n=1 Tax=Candidatus Poriferisodalis sp. TaxID=3101277 RepID=UPI003B58D2DC
MIEREPQSIPAVAEPSAARPRRRCAGSVDTSLLELSDTRIHEPQRIAASEHGMVSTAHYSATAAGVQMLERGGNAIDAAVAAALALGVCEPAASGLGGQTMMVIHDGASGRTVALDGSSRAPNRALVERFANLTEDRRRGHLATTVPSSPAVYAHALANYGKLDWSTVCEPAIVLAEEGYEISLLQYRLTRRERRRLAAHSGSQFFLQDGRRAYRAGTMFTQPVLARTLRRLSEQGFEDFYLGETARLIGEDMEANGGIVLADDLAQIPHPIERRPLSVRFGRDRVLTMPLPGAGRTLVEMLNIHQSLPRELQDIDTPEGAVCLAETIRLALIDRKDRPFDPNLYSPASDKQMLNRQYARGLASGVAQRFGHGETTHLSVMDAHGNVVALTQSIENVYGSCAASAELGFLYNNYMSAFQTEDVTHPYYLRPNAVPWASVAPTIVFRSSEPWLAIGSPGSERIPPTILQVLLRLRKSSPMAAVDAPRIHCSLQGEVSVEASRIATDVLVALKDAGFVLNRREPYSFYLGCAQLVMRDGGRLIGVADPRRDGAAAGPASVPASASTPGTGSGPAAAPSPEPT